MALQFRIGEVITSITNSTNFIMYAPMLLVALTLLYVKPRASFLMEMKKYLKLKWDLFVYPITVNERIKAAYATMGEKPFRIHAPESWITLVSSPELINDIRAAADDQLSLNTAAKQFLKPDYTMNGFNWYDTRREDGIGFVRTLRTILTLHLPKLTPGVRVIIDRTFTQELKASKSVNVLGVFKRVVTQISAYAFFGLDQLENDELIDAAYHYSENVVYGSELIRLTPQFLVPVTGLFIRMFMNRQRTFFNGLVSMIEERVNNPDPAKKHNDVVQWIIDTSPKSNPWSPDRMALEVMAIWFGAVLSTATTLTFAIYNLCENPQYIQPLREEMESSAIGEFLVTGEGLPLLDSFLKESARWTPLENVTAHRCALKDFYFSDGTHVAKGEWAGIPVGPIMRDPSKFPQPDVFDAFRFVDPRLLGKESSRQPDGPSKFTDVSDSWFTWGTGKLTCPGRFYVSYVMKHMFYHILENYEPEMDQPDRKPTVNWRTLTVPWIGVKATFKPRV